MSGMLVPFTPEEEASGYRESPARVVSEAWMQVPVENPALDAMKIGTFNPINAHSGRIIRVALPISLRFHHGDVLPFLETPTHVFEIGLVHEIGRGLIHVLKVTLDDPVAMLPGWQWVARPWPWRDLVEPR